MKISERSISIAALIVSLASAAFSYLQLNSSEKQFVLDAQQLRPHITYVPTFFPSKDGLRIDMYLQNQSPLPANVLFTDVAASLNGEVFRPHFYSLHPDIIYQGRDGVSTIPTITGGTFEEISDGGATLLVATCAVYSSTSQLDERRWMIKAINEYVPGSSLPSRRLITEQEVSMSVDRCVAKTVLVGQGDAELKR